MLVLLNEKGITGETGDTGNELVGLLWPEQLVIDE
jgi:hypothetical protein